MLAHDVDFAFLMRREYHRRDTKTVVGGFLHVSQKVRSSISSFDEQCMVLHLKLCETEEERILLLLLPYYD